MLVAGLGSPTCECRCQIQEEFCTGISPTYVFNPRESYGQDLRLHVPQLRFKLWPRLFWPLKFSLTPSCPHQVSRDWHHAWPPPMFETDDDFQISKFELHKSYCTTENFQIFAYDSVKTALPLLPIQQILFPLPLPHHGQTRTGIGNHSAKLGIIVAIK